MTSPDLSAIVHARVHPGIGIARIGDSENDYLIGPETTEPEPREAADYKDATGALKRQAARFRLYGYDAAGQVVAELTAANAEIDWQVELVNSKAAWYEFQVALDVPEAADPDAAEPSCQRNRAVQDRDSLIIDPGPRSVTGCDTQGPAFDTGTFLGTPVYLGELRTDDAGRLLVLGGRGVSASATGAPPVTFANNEGWHDDTSDGPVTATVRIGGTSIPVDGGWVAVAPPNYAPALKSVRTMYDLLVDLYLQAGWLTRPATVSFTGDVLPILTRLCELQWANHGFATAYGWGGRQHFLDPGYLAQLANPAAEFAEARQLVWNSSRNWDRDGESPVPWPWLYGDTMSLPPVSVRQHSTLSATQYAMMQRWAAGDFLADYDPAAPAAPSSIDQVPLDLQPAALDRAALEFCLADAFHPGCELTWPMRHLTMYSEPFRIRRRESGTPPCMGPLLTYQNVTVEGGPLYEQSPGDLTRWMAVPWQTDTASCRSGYTSALTPAFDPYLPTFWPARVPNHVLTQADYDTVLDTSLPLADRREAFERRAAWLRFLPGDYQLQLATMVSDFGKLGVVAAQPGPTDSPDFPASLQVESDVSFDVPPPPPHRNLLTLHSPEAVAGAEPDLMRALPDLMRALPVPIAPEDVTVADIDLVRRFRRRPR
ncbi:LodA/GoxA family CTQ-dependent oxidase [Jatrophihabitans sp.]|jgi:hypothetical protein|uniref:LodA/GoxA family CTQ-dependent oxidase n=1 Tax=Jatrophihabitans sp. TaxID=1932789 RepID=UPI002F1E56E7